MIAAYNNVLPDNNLEAIEDLCAEIESGDVDKNIENIKRHRLYPATNFDLEDKNAIVYARAEAAYLRMCQLGRERKLPFVGGTTDKVNKIIRRIDVIGNEKLEKGFLEKKEEFCRKKISYKEQLFFHGTDPSHISQILNENFNLASNPANRPKQAFYGKGI